jgi:hypothetical protein
VRRVNSRSTRFASRYGFGEQPDPTAVRSAKYFRCTSCERVCCLRCGIRCKTEDDIDPVIGRYCAAASCVLIEAQRLGKLCETVERLNEYRRVPCEHTK